MVRAKGEVAGGFNVAIPGRNIQPDGRYSYNAEN